MRLRSVAGLVLLIGIAWLLSRDRRRFPWRTVLGGLGLQVVLALLVLRTATGVAVFNWLGELVSVLIEASNAGSRFIFGNLVDHSPDRWGFVFAARALPTIIVFASISAIGYHVGALQRVVGVMARLMQMLMRVSGAESLSAAGNIFLGQTEAPLLVRPYIPQMTISELNAVMVGGFATIAGSLMAVYAAMLGHEERAAMAGFFRHLLTASLMSAPASLVMAKIMLPERGEPATAGRVKMRPERTTRNLVDAAATGALEGLRLAINVAGMLIAFIALIYLVDALLGWCGQWPPLAAMLRRIGIPRLELNAVLGLLFSPVAYAIGIPGGECRTFGSLLGQAMAANEFIAYKSLAEQTAAHTLSPRSVSLAIYALCGFANFSSIAIQIAGIGGMAPDRRHDLATLGMRAMFGGALACWMTACVAAVLT